MMELNREQIIKALECVFSDTCGSCVYKEIDKCQEWAARDAISFINSQEQRVKELTEENEKLNERLDREARCQYDLCGQIVNLRDDVKYIKADTVRKFLDKFKDWPSDDQEYIERYAKEILEENK